MIKIFRKLHLWLSIPFGVIVTLICFSGAMMVFEPEITLRIKKDVYYVSEVKEKPLPMEQLMETVKATLPDSVAITGVTVFNNPARTYQVGLSKPMRASLFIDQYSGKITGNYERLGFFMTMFKLHRWLLDSSNPHGDGIKIGKLLVGIATLVFVVVLITGVIIWYPRARKNLKRSLTISLANGGRIFWKGLHVAGGMYALIIVLAMALTGLTWSFEWYRNAFYAVCGVENTPRNIPQAGSTRGNAQRERQGKDGSEDAGQSEFRYWQEVYDDLRTNNPDAPQITISPGSASVTLGDFGNVRAADRYRFNTHDGSVTLQTPYSDSSDTDKVRGWISSIHMGAFGGIFTRIVWMLSALLGASLPMTGYYIWINHLRKKKTGDSRLKTRLPQNYN